MSEIDQQETQTKLQQVQNNFGAAAADYVTSKVHAQGQDLAWLAEAAMLTGRERVLDVATGGGHAAFALAPRAAEVIALDLTPPMLEVAQKEAEARSLTNIRFLEGNAQAIPCRNGEFDIVSCRQAAHHFPDIHQAVSEWHRVLKSAGTLLLIDSASPEEPEIATLLHEIEILRDPSHMRNHSVSEWKTVLGEAGFSIKTLQEWGITLDIPSWTRRMRTPAEAVARIETLLQEASPAKRQRLDIQEQDGVFSFTLPAVFIVATRAE